jgi:hypothetical protein
MLDKLLDRWDQKFLTMAGTSGDRSKEIVRLNRIRRDCLVGAVACCALAGYMSFRGNDSYFLWIAGALQFFSFDQVQNKLRLLLLLERQFGQHHNPAGHSTT